MKMASKPLVKNSVFNPSKLPSVVKGNWTSNWVEKTIGKGNVDSKKKKNRHEWSNLEEKSKIEKCNLGSFYRNRMIKQIHEDIDEIKMILKKKEETFKTGLSATAPKVDNDVVPQYLSKYQESFNNKPAIRSEYSNNCGKRYFEKEAEQNNYKDSYYLERSIYGSEISSTSHRKVAHRPELIREIGSCERRYQFESCQVCNNDETPIDEMTTHGNGYLYDDNRKQSVYYNYGDLYDINKRQATEYTNESESDIGLQSDDGCHDRTEECQSVLPRHFQKSKLLNENDYYYETENVREEYDSSFSSGLSSREESYVSTEEITLRDIYAEILNLRNKQERFVDRLKAMDNKYEQLTKQLVHSDIEDTEKSGKKSMDPFEKCRQMIRQRKLLRSRVV